jgi:hypothetical protein
MIRRAAAIAVFLLQAAASAALEPAAGSTPSFAVREPADPIPLTLSSPRLAAWGHTPKLRLIYYATDGQAPNDLDRRTILRELRLIKDFYFHYGLIVTTEDMVFELRADSPNESSAKQHSYHAIMDDLQRRQLLIARRTIVFTTFDVGLGAEMALTGLNDANVAKLECPRPGKGFAWWCGRPEAAHWGGSVHEVGHMLGLSHPDVYTSTSPYVFSGGAGTYVYDQADAEKSLMIRHDLFFRHPDNGLLPHEIDLLYHQYHDAGAAEPAAASPRS